MMGCVSTAQCESRMPRPTEAVWARQRAVVPEPLGEQLSLETRHRFHPSSHTLIFPGGTKFSYSAI